LCSAVGISGIHAGEDVNPHSARLFQQFMSKAELPG